MDVTWSTHTGLDVMQEKKIDDYWTVGSCKLFFQTPGEVSPIFSSEREASKRNTCGPGGD